jgi:tetratricopeptide (TPR) repeat protein
MDAPNVDLIASEILKYFGPTSGDESDMNTNTAITIAQALLSTLDDDDPMRHLLTEPVAMALCRRYERHNEWEDLEKAIDYLQISIQNTEDDDDARVASLSHNYARCLRNRFMRGRSEKEIENAIDFAEKSVDHSRKVDGMSNMILAERLQELSISYFTKAHQLDDYSGSLEKAITCAREGLSLLSEEPSGTAIRYSTISSLGGYLQTKFDRDEEGSFAVLDEALRLGRSLLEWEDASPSNMVSILSDLSVRLLRAARYHLKNRGTSTTAVGQACLDEAVERIYQSMAIEGEAPFIKLNNVLSFVLEVENLPKVPQGEVLRRIDRLLEDALELLPQTALVAQRNDQRDVIATLYGLSGYAAAAALEAGAKPFKALQLLEYGRGIVLSMHLSSREDPSCLQSDHPELEEYSAICAEVRSLTFQSKELEERIRLMRRQEELRALLHKNSGLPHFDKVMGRENMLELASEGPIVAINITTLRSDALVILSDDIQAIPLPGLDDTVLSDHSWEIQWRLAHRDRDEVFAELHDNLLHDLDVIWRLLTEPVLNYLGYNGTHTELPRVWWIPTGVLSLFPLHAAADMESGDNVMDRVVSSYTLSLKALAQNRVIDVSLGQMDPDANHPTALVVTMEKTPGNDDLLLSSKEASAVESLFPEANVLREPCKADVLEALKGRYSVVHLTCHGETMYEDPIESRILLSDWQETPLTVADLQRRDLKNIQLAFLSLCFAAHAGVENEQDEGLHLANAIQVAGISSVVASMWYVSETAALQVVESFYEYFRSRGGFDVKHAARALHQAVTKLRESTRDPFNDEKGDPTRWAPFVHYGV